MYKDSDLTFEDALALLKKGFKMTRSGWNGKGIFLYYVPAANYPAITEIAKKSFPSGNVPYGAYIAIKTAQNTVECGWRPTNPDMFASDWMIVE